MSRELTGLYRSLAEDTDPRGLASPDVVRRHADRRARARAAVGVLALAALVGGTAVGTQFVLTAGPDTPVGPPAGTPAPPSVSPPPADPTPAPSVSSTPSALPSRTTPSAPPSAGGGPPVRTPTSIPDSAFFALAAANDTGAGAAFSDGPVLPRLCGAEPGGSGVVRQRVRAVPFKLATTPEGYVPDGLYRHSITSYRSGRADDALRELRAAVQGCPEQQIGSVTSRQKLLPDGGYGDESVLFEMRKPFLDANDEPTGDEEVRLIRAIRVGNVVTVLWEQGWEGSSSPKSQVDADSRRAVQAIRDWLD
ncbi:hypothetical protein [Micromonospora halophytica]|uniref:PknH-like extracellular domain-containing protein n=1 Tax=Micromonospora halophytica TaxID=47864 RepID=A0A1C5GJP1_9ACTN|nr:hypothetical protein [Micromonospora halophytica]SCG34010.1 hypothetical protein GA0070560_101144 [Micromonospora halophytica]